MNKRLKLGVLLAAIAGGLLAVAVGFAYGLPTTQQSNQSTCGSAMNGAGEMGMMGGMNHYGSMGQSRCRSHMGQQGMGQCLELMTTEVQTQAYGMMQDENATMGCY